MTRVCEKWFPKGTYKGQRQDGFYMHHTLKEQLDVLLKNIMNDWDFTIVISGGGEVRLGKSVLAMQISCYFAYEMNFKYNKKVPFSVDNFILEGQKLIEKGNELGEKYPYSPLVYDEAGAELSGRKIMKGATGEVLDYFRECGQYNLFNILVIPEFFDLPKGIAITRSIFLIDVFYTASEDGIFQRGFFKFFSRRSKKYLYLKGKKELNYSASKPNFVGEFFDVYTIDKKKYRAIKAKTLKHRSSQTRSKVILQRNAAFYLLTKDLGWSQEELGKRIENLTGVYTPQRTISDAIGGADIIK